LAPAHEPTAEHTVQSIPADVPFDPHEALLKKLKSTSMKTEAPSSPSSSRPQTMQTTAEAPVDRAYAERARDTNNPFVPPRGLAAAISAVVSKAETSRPLSQSIESAFGMPQIQIDRGGDASQPVFGQYQMHAGAFAIDPPDITRAPVAPVHLEPNPYLLPTYDSNQVPKRRLGLPKPQRPPDRDTLNSIAAQALNEAKRSQPSVPQTRARTDEQVDLALTPSNQQYTARPKSGGGSAESSPQVLNLKPLIPRAMVPQSSFKISEVRMLFSFARHGRYSELKKLVMKGVPIDARDENGNTALIIACQNGQGRCVKLLVRSGADPNAQNKIGNSALHFSVHFRFDAISDFLQRHGGLTTLQNLDGVTCFEFIG